MTTKTTKMQQVLNVFGVILIVWSVYRWKLQMPEWFDEFIAKPIVFVGPVYWYITQTEQKEFLSSIWLRFKKIGPDVLMGIALGGIFLASALFANVLKHGTIELPTTFAGTSFILAVLMTFATAATEEILTRGFILKRFFEDSGNIYMSSFNASILFLVLHIPILFTIPELRGTLLLMFLATDFVLSLVNSFIFLDRKSLVAPILVHAFYNLAILFYI
jgi:membrane protease YdiL (CAAX protease family)